MKETVPATAKKPQQNKPQKQPTKQPTNQTTTTNKPKKKKDLY